MTDIEIDIYHYLKSQSGQFTPAIDISRRVAKRRFRVNPHWALSVLPQMVERGILESDGSEAYRIASSILEKIAKERKSQRWLAPHIRRIFETCRKDLSQTITLDDPELNILISLQPALHEHTRAFSALDKYPATHFSCRQFVVMAR